MNRLFVAYDIDEELKKEIKRISEKMFKSMDYKLKAVASGNYHITIEFLGDIKNPEEVKKIMDEAYIRESVIYLDKISFFPQNNPRVIYIHTELNEEIYKETINMKQKLNSLLVHANIHTGSHNKYIPHITIARTKQKLTEQEINKLKTFNFETIKTRIKSITLYNSNLTPGGQEYIKIYSKKL